MQYYYQEFTPLYSISPTYGPVIGGTTVTLYGENFEHPMYCKFGNGSSVIATVINSTEMTCISTEVNNATFVDLEISNNGMVHSNACSI